MAIGPVANPNPVWNYSTSSWTYPPPPSGVGAARWTVDDLPDPSGFTDGFYPLGTPSASDASIGIASAAQQWSPNGSTPTAPAFHSAYPFKPEVRPYSHLRSDGDTVDFPTAVVFDNYNVEQLWADTGALLTPPFTLLAVAIVRTFPEVGYTHYLFDAGADPTTGGKTFSPLPEAPTAIGEAYAYRTALTARLNTVEAFSDPSAVDNHLSVPYTDNAKPRMFYAIFNGSSSAMGHYSAEGQFQKTGNLPNHGAQRFLVMGRANGEIDPDQASSMIMFEIRIWQSALTLAQLAEQYDQLSSTFSFHEFS